MNSLEEKRVRKLLKSAKVEVFERHRFSLRFLNPRTEKCFVEMQADILSENLFWLGFICTCASLSRVVYLARLGTLEPDAEQTWQLNIYAAVACTIVSALATIWAKIPAVVRSFRPLTREIMVVCLIVVLALLQFFVDPWYGARVLQADVDAVRSNLSSANPSDTRPILALSILVVAGHLALPIRWVCLFPLEVIAVFLYAVFAFYKGGPDGSEAWSTLLLFQFLVFCAAIGRRTIEDYQRHVFGQFIQERNLRVRTEFQVSQMEERKKKGGLDGDPARDVSLRPETTPSAKVFEVGDVVQNVVGLRRCMELGHSENWYVDEGELVLSPEIIGEGSYGIVLAATFYGSPVAVKANKIEMDTEEGSGHNSRVISLLNEVRILRRVRHPNIVLLHGACFDAVRGDMALVLERVHGKTLAEIVEDQISPLSVSDRLRAIVDISRALRYLHSRDPAVVHGDLKATNIVGEQVPGSGKFLRAKLLDFGLARMLTRHAKPLGGTLRWMAPEVVLYPDRDPEVPADVFSFGRVAGFVMTGAAPFQGKSRHDIKKIIISGSLPEMPWPGNMEPPMQRLRMLVDSCSAFDHLDRPKMEEAGPCLEDIVLAVRENPKKQKHARLDKTWADLPVVERSGKEQDEGGEGSSRPRTQSFRPSSAAIENFLNRMRFSQSLLATSGPPRRTPSSARVVPWTQEDPTFEFPTGVVPMRPRDEPRRESYSKPPERTDTFGTVS